MQLILIPGVDILGWRALAGAGTAFGATRADKGYKNGKLRMRSEKTRDQSDSKARAFDADHKDRSSGTRISAVRFINQTKRAFKKNLAVN